MCAGWEDSVSMLSRSFPIGPPTKAAAGKEDDSSVAAPAGRAAGTAEVTAAMLLALGRKAGAVRLRASSGAASADAAGEDDKSTSRPMPPGRIDDGSCASWTTTPAGLAVPAL
jgi:hypothetical protein